MESNVRNHNQSVENWKSGSGNFFKVLIPKSISDSSMGKNSHFSLKNEEGADFPICQLQKDLNNALVQKDTSKTSMDGLSHAT